MKGYRCASDVFQGDVILWSGEVYVVTSDMSSNNGNFKAVTSDGILRWFNTALDDFVIMVRA